MASELGPRELRYWANQHGQGIVVGEELYRDMVLAARLEGLPVEDWLAEVLARKAAETLEGPDPSWGTAEGF